MTEQEVAALNYFKRHLGDNVLAVTVKEGTTPCGFFTCEFDIYKITVTTTRGEISAEIGPTFWHRTFSDPKSKVGLFDEFQMWSSPLEDDYIKGNRLAKWVKS